MEKYQLTEERVFFIATVVNQELRALEEYIDLKLRVMRDYMETLLLNVESDEEE